MGFLYYDRLCAFLTKALASTCKFSCCSVIELQAFFFFVLRVIWLTLIHLLINFSETTWINSICTIIIVVFCFRCRARGIAAEQYGFCWENNHWHCTRTAQKPQNCPNAKPPGHTQDKLPSNVNTVIDMHVLLLLLTWENCCAYFVKFSLVFNHVHTTSLIQKVLTVISVVLNTGGPDNLFNLKFEI